MQILVTETGTIWRRQLSIPVKDIKLYVTKQQVLRYQQMIQRSVEIIERGDAPSRVYSSKVEIPEGWLRELTLTLRRILSKNGTLFYRESPKEELFSMQRYMQYLEQINLMQYILPELTDKELRNLQSLVNLAEKLSKIPESVESSTPSYISKTLEMGAITIND